MKKCFLIVIPVLILLCIYVVLKNKYTGLQETKIIGNMNTPRVCANVLIKNDNMHILEGYPLPLSSNVRKEEIFNLQDNQLKNSVSHNISMDNFDNNYIIVRNAVYNRKTGKEIIVKTKNLYVDNASEVYELDYDMGTPVIVIVNKYNTQNPIQILYWNEDSFYDTTPKIPKEIKSYNLVSAFKLGLYEMSFIFTKGNDVYVVSYLAMDNYMRIIKHFKTQCSNPSFAYNTDKFHKNISIFIVGGLKEEKDIKCVPNLNLNNENACNSIEVLIFQQ